MMNKLCPNPRSGFTLIELLAVFAIVSLIAGFGIASLVDYSRKQALSQEAANFKQIIETARFDALSSVKPSVCSSSSVLSSYTVSVCNNPSSCTTVPNGKGYETRVTCGASSTIISTKQLPSYGNFTISTLSTCKDIKFDALTANPSGIGSSCTVILSAYSKTATITIDAQGYVSIQQQ